MSEKIECKDCRFCQSGYCHRMPPTLVSWHKDALFPKVDNFDWCGMAERREEAKAMEEHDAAYMDNFSDQVFVSTSENGKESPRINGVPMETFVTRLHQKSKELQAENRKLRGLITEIRELFDWRGRYRGTSPLKSECLMEIYAIANEEDEKRRAGK